jgi:hypothetical protein
MKKCLVARGPMHAGLSIRHVNMGLRIGTQPQPVYGVAP